MILSWIVFLGATVRIPVIMNSSFPANDGGMFMQAIVQLKANHFVLPMYLHYNGLTLPYAYPPIGFYLAGILSSVTHMSVLNTLRFIPLTFSVATIVAFILFANAFLKNRAMVIAATLAFALVPNGHEWEIMGGGLTRSIGFFFAVLALWQTYLLFTERSRTHLLLTIVFVSLVCMSHLEMALFAAITVAVIFLFFARTKRGLYDSALVAGGVLLMTSPWWVVVVQHHGLSPFLSAGGTSGRSVLVIVASLLTFNWGDEHLFPFFSALALLGSIFSLTRRKYFLPAWAGILLLADPRMATTYDAVPLSILIAICVVELLIPIMNRSLIVNSGVLAGRSEGSPSRSTAGIKWFTPAVLSMLVVVTWFGSLGATQTKDVSLSLAERQAMEWVRTSTPSNSAFLIVDGDRWGSDRTSEWFPALTDRRSLATVQGYEWLPDGAFARKVSSYIELQKCIDAAPICVDQWSKDRGAEADYLYVARRVDKVHPAIPYNSALIGALSQDPGYILVFQNQDASIFRIQPVTTQVDSPNTSQTQ